MLTSKRGDLLYLGRGDVSGKDAAYPHALSVDLEHDSRGTFAIHAEKFLQNDDHEVHGREVIVEQKHLEQGRRTGARPLRLEDEFVLFPDTHEIHSNGVVAECNTGDFHRSLSACRTLVADMHGCRGVYATLIVRRGISCKCA